MTRIVDPIAFSHVNYYYYYLAASWVTLSYYQGDRLTQQMLMGHCVIQFRIFSYPESHNEVWSLYLVKHLV